jgi:KDO2-lipid IV(A) lauroyltransferase
MNFKKIKTNLAIGIAKLMAKLPLSVILSLGKFLGWLTWIVPNKRKNIAQRNIQLCFPEKSQGQQAQLLKENLISTGMGFMEMIVAFWSDKCKFLNKFEFLGLEHVADALKQQQGCILMSCHLHPMELACRAINLTLKQPAYLLARQHNNKIYEAHIDIARRQHCEKTIDKKDLRTVIQSLKDNRCICYYPDQNFSYYCLYIDFFKQPAATVIALDKLAKKTAARVVPWFVFREKNMWKIEFLPALDYFHSDKTESCLTRMNQLFEQQIRRHPEQYLWVHRRFKNHPKGKNYLYRNL